MDDGVEGVLRARGRRGRFVTWSAWICHRFAIAGLTNGRGLCDMRGISGCGFLAFGLARVGIREIASARQLGFQNLGVQKEVSNYLCYNVGEAEEK